MKLLFSILFSFVCLGISKAQNLYSKPYGEKKNPAIIFIHGGPSGNSNLFEATTAQKLADKGFYVIVYDRRGEGRSKDDNATMTFKESFDDLNQIYKLYHLEKANILAHSFGGIVATLYTNQYPEKVKSLILAGALISQQETYDHILGSAKIAFKNNANKLQEIYNIETLSKNSAEYRKKTYDIASDLGYFSMPNPTKESQTLRQEFENSEFYKSNFKNQNSPLLFYKNETQSNLDNKAVLLEIKKKKIPLFAIYGQNDAIFSEKQLTDLRNIVGTNNFKVLDNCSHYLFVDQQSQFLDFIKLKVKK
ncbi:alpha/beta hydrolase [Soonwooa sp.]|uniref:alpha/beta hydrolase n=1 Tax=Soonwooa sp. TaxID=1938592 RepID=UPI00261BAD60|nr:alpha/beta hydrolase [Soonwooa sp.]